MHSRNAYIKHLTYILYSVCVHSLPLAHTDGTNTGQGIMVFINRLDVKSQSYMVKRRNPLKVL